MKPFSLTTSPSLLNDTTAEDSLNPPPPGLGMLVRDCVSVEHGTHVVVASLVKGTMCVCVCVCVCVCMRECVCGCVCASMYVQIYTFVCVYFFFFWYEGVRV